MVEDLYTLLKNCFSEMADIDINDNNMIAIKLKNKYIKTKNRKSIDSELDLLIEQVFVNYEEKEYFNPGIVGQNYGYKETTVSKKNDSDIVDKNYKHNDSKQ